MNGGKILAEGEASTSHKPSRSSSRGGRYRKENDSKAFAPKERSSRKRDGEPTRKSAAKGKSRAKPGVHTPTERRSGAGLYRKKSAGPATEY